MPPRLFPHAEGSTQTMGPGGSPFGSLTPPPAPSRSSAGGTAGCRGRIWLPISPATRCDCLNPDHMMSIIYTEHDAPLAKVIAQAARIAPMQSADISMAKVALLELGEHAIYPMLCYGVQMSVGTFCLWGQSNFEHLPEPPAIHALRHARLALVLPLHPPAWQGRSLTLG